MPVKKKESAEVYQLKITLDGIKPAIWRCFQVRGDVTLGRLHGILQSVMGWTDSHLHQFIIRDECNGPCDPDLDLEVADEKKVRLNQLTGLKDKFVYQYDFGDGWEHGLVVEKVLPADLEGRFPRCLDGARRCPAEDCGGPWGYGEFLEAILDPTHPDHDEKLEWFGGEFDPEAFDVGEVNQLLQHSRR